MAFQRLSDLSPPRRLAVGLFLVLIVGFYLLAQVQLMTVVGTSGSFPGPAEVLARYHGDPKRSRLHKVLDSTLSPDDARNMYQFLALAEDERPAKRATLLAWVEEGMPRSGWDRVKSVFTSPETCGGCHAPGARKADRPFDTYEHVKANVGADHGMLLADLTTTSHNHLMGFSVLALLVSFVFTSTRWRGPLVVGLVAGAFAGAAVDVASWWLTHAYGHPWEHAVIAGGGLYGASLMAMLALSLDELWLGGRVSSWIAKPLSALRLGRREDA